MMSLSLLLVGLLGTQSINAGCYRNGRTKPQRAWEDEHLNHVGVPQLDRKNLPKSFNWYARHLPSSILLCHVHVVFKHPVSRAPMLH